ncbi:class I SAM-dependent methyltransferase [Patescibacteria group bacterium]
MKEKGIENNIIQRFNELSYIFPEKISSFDFLICVEALSHVPETEKAVMEMARVLKSKGRLFVIDKSIVSLRPSYFIPTSLWKVFLENRNKWFYPKNFSFKKKYFVPWKLNRVLKKYFSQTKTSFIRAEHEGKNQLILKVHNMVSSVFYRLFPFLNLFVGWEGIK